MKILLIVFSLGMTTKANDVNALENKTTSMMPLEEPVLLYPSGWIQVLPHSSSSSSLLRRSNQTKETLGKVVALGTGLALGSLATGLLSAKYSSSANYPPNYPVYSQNYPVYPPNNPVYPSNNPVYPSNNPVYSPNNPVYSPNYPVYPSNTPHYSPNYPPNYSQPPIYSPSTFPLPQYSPSSLGPQYPTNYFPFPYRPQGLHRPSYLQGDFRRIVNNDESLLTSLPIFV